MKLKSLLTLFLVLICQIILACPVCEKQQPAITAGLSHGTGPQSNWDWLIIGVISVITILTLIYSIKYLVKPGEKNPDHIKQSILTQ